MEQRRFKRFKTNLLVSIKTLGNVKDSNEALKATNISLGGIFLSTIYPFPKDTIVELTIKLPGIDETVKWKGIVKWVSNDTDNPGNGIEFIEFENIDKEKLSLYIASEYQKELITMCEANSLYKNMLILWHKYKNKEFEYSSLTKFFNTTNEELSRVLNFFADLKMIEISGARVKFLDIKELSSIEDYIKKAEKT